MKKIEKNTTHNFLHDLSKKSDVISSEITSFFKRNFSIILILFAVALAAYGFELFNLNLTIDEELASLNRGMDVWQIGSGRWGKYFLANALLPLSTIPFVPLCIALIFQIGAILLMMNVFEIKGKKEQIIVGTIGISYSGMAFIYNFSTANYLVGIGIFCVALSLFIYAKDFKARNYISIIPSVIAISIYQPLIPALISVYLLYIIYFWNKSGFQRLLELKNIIIINVFSVIIYFLVTKLLITLYGITISGYVTHFFDMMCQRFSATDEEIKSFVCKQSMEE